MARIFIFIIIAYTLVSCNRHTGPSGESVAYVYASDLSSHILGYQLSEGDYTENLNDLKENYISNELSKELWDKYIYNKWQYTKPIEAEGKQIILKEFEYGFIVEAEYIDGEMKIIYIGKHSHPAATQ